MPPATITSLSPVAMAWAASITALSPEPQTMLTVRAATRSGSPPRSAACRAGFWPRPAPTTLPMMHWSTCRESIPARRTASATTIAPSSGALKSLSAPRNLPVGVRTALTMTTSRTGHPLRHRTDLEACHCRVTEESLQPGEDDLSRTPDFARPLRADGFDHEHIRLE